LYGLGITIPIVDRDLLKTEYLRFPTDARDFCSTIGGANKKRCSAVNEHEGEC